MKRIGKNRVFVGLAALMAAVMVLAMPGAALAVEPGLYLVEGNPNCANLYQAKVLDGPASDLLGLGPLFGFKYDANPKGDLTHTLTNDGVWKVTNGPQDSVNSVSIFNVAVSEGEGVQFDWSATLGIDAVIVKAQDANAYVYSPEAFGDSGLVAPGNKAISHVEFCYDYELTATKTAAAKYTRTYTWKITKDFDGEYWKFIGDPATTHDYKVSVDQTVTDSDFKVTGEITIKNPTPFKVSFEVSDDVGGTAATVTCPSYKLDPGDSVKCSYVAELGDTKPDDGTNTATIASKNPDVKGAEATADYVFGDPTTIVGYPDINVSDSNGKSWKASGDASWDYTKDFTCPTDQSKYKDGLYSFDHKNTATIKETGQSDDAKVTVNCYAPVLSKDASASYDERHIWDVDKTVNPELQGGFPGSVLPWTWKVVVSETFVEEKFKVTGKINVANPAGSPGNMTVSLVDQLNDGTFATVDCGDGATSVTVAPGSTGTCDYTAIPGGRTATENKATGTFNSIKFVATYPVSFIKNVVNGTATVKDTKIGLNKSLTASNGPWTFTKDYSHTCSDNRADYFDNGVYKQMTWTEENWAYVYSDNELQDKDDATTTYTCDASFVDILKTTNGEIDPSKDIRFKLYDDTGADLNDEVSTLNDADGRLLFQTALVPDDSYTICESPVPAGYTFEITVDGGNVLIYPGPPGEANPTGEIQCFDFVAADSPTTLLFEVNNSFPGGAPRTPGYWKNWSTCSGGNQAQTAAKLGGVAEGVFLLDDLLPQTVGDLVVETCKVGVSILDARDIKSGKNRANDAAYTLARSYLAALLNQNAGACDPDGLTFDVAGVGDDLTFQEVLNAAQALLDAQDFDGTGGYLGPKDKSGDREIALALYSIIDDYNNSELCTGEESH